MTSPRLVLGLSRDTAHAVLEGSLDALCGAHVDELSTSDFPGSARSVCRACVRESAAAASTVPLRGLGGRKRPGGM